MGRPSKGYDQRFTLRMSDNERAVIEHVRRRHAESGVTLSENDVIVFLIHCAAIPAPLTTTKAREAIELHWKHCLQCTPDTQPACAAGVYLRDCYTRVRATEDARAAAARKVDPLGSPPPRRTPQHPPRRPLTEQRPAPPTDPTAAVRMFN